jgi:hypothetical protein
VAREFEKVYVKRVLNPGITSFLEPSFLTRAVSLISETKVGCAKK